MPDYIPWFFGERSWNHHCPVSGSGHGRFEEFAGVVVRPKQEIDARTQLDILAAGLVEKDSALIDRQRQGGIEDGLFARWIGRRRRCGLRIGFHRWQHRQYLRMWKVVFSS